MPTAKRVMVDYFMEVYKMRERKACRLMNISVSSYRYCVKDISADEVVKERLISLSQKYIRYGYRRLHAHLRQIGFNINHKKTYRLYKEAHLMYAQKKSRKVKYVKTAPSNPATALNQIWSMDFVSDALTDKRQIRCLNIIDNHSRFNMAIEVAIAFPSVKVTHILDQVIKQYGSPQSIVIDNGPEFRSKIFSS